MRPLAYDLVNWENGTVSWNFPRGKYKSTVVWSVIRPRKERVAWFKLVWSSMNLPKHAFISWLAILNRLPQRIE